MHTCTSVVVIFADFYIRVLAEPRNSRELAHDEIYSRNIAATQLDVYIMVSTLYGTGAVKLREHRTQFCRTLDHCN